jgi:hypothetical protein
VFEPTISTRASWFLVFMTVFLNTEIVARGTRWVPHESRNSSTSTSKKLRQLQWWCLVFTKKKQYTVRKLILWNIIPWRLPVEISNVWRSIYKEINFDIVIFIRREITHDRIISLRGEVRAHKTSRLPPPF